MGNKESITNINLTNIQKVAWRVRLNDMSCIVFASTAPKARWIAVRSYWDAYGRRQSWPSINAVRAPIYDKRPEAEMATKAYSEEYLLS